MKRKLLFLTLLIFTFTAGIATAGSVNGTYDGFQIIKIFSGGKELKPDIVPAINYKGNTLVPIGVLRSLGVDVQWDGATQRVDIKLPTRTVYALTEAQLQELSKAVYKITTGPTKAYPYGKQGSGFIIDGYMITAKHVASDTEYAEAQINGSWQRVNDYAFVSDKVDVMGFKVSGGTSLPYSTELPQVGDPVYSIGYPDGKLTITEGEVVEIWPSNAIFTRENGIKIYAGNGMKFSHTAKTAPGSSGGVLLNGKGQVIGININADDESNIALAIQEAIKYIK